VVEVAENPFFVQPEAIAPVSCLRVEGGLMHGQKKRRKRLVDGKIEIGEIVFNWRLVSEPLWSNEHGYKGLCISVQAEGEVGRGLILQYPYPTNKLGSPLPLPQRPKFTVRTIEHDVQLAMKDGREPLSRGKALVFCLS
jgi:hypothetical protein